MKFAQLQVVTTKNPVRFIKPNPFTCHGVHATDGLLGSGAIPETDKPEYAMQIFKQTLQEYMSISSNANLEDRLERLGHAIEIYAKYKKYFPYTVRKILKFMINEIPKIISEIQKPNNRDVQKITFEFSHFYSALKILQK